MRRLNGLWDEIAEPRDRVFLKTDTQGYDLRVLHGAASRLLEVSGILTELNVIKLYDGAPHYLDVIKFIEDNGFSVMELRQISLRKGFVVEFDCFAARR